MDKKVKIMTFGTIHLQTDGVEYLDMLSDNRQQELLNVVNRLANFKPNKVLLEQQPQYEKDMNDRYQRYCKDGIINITPEHYSDLNERISIGCRIAKMCGIDYLYCIDYMNDWLQNDAIQYAKEHQPELAKVIEEKIEEELNATFVHQYDKLVDLYCYLNSEEALLLQHRNCFLSFNAIGVKPDYIGNKFVTSWYDRNLKIFANLQNIVEEDDRVLIIYGAAHLHIINTLIRESYNMEYISPISYLV